MSQDDKQAVATLAAAIVVARGATEVSAIRQAWTDARWIISPLPANAGYKAWQESHGETPTTLEEDSAAKVARKRASTSIVSKFA